MPPQGHAVVELSWTHPCKQPATLPPLLCCSVTCPFSIRLAAPPLHSRAGHCSVGMVQDRFVISTNIHSGLAASRQKTLLKYLLKLQNLQGGGGVKNVDICAE
ncbi:UNVERIFIED_CONTAM: hypothetical protein K2H54_058823 [Gekko kuhli]